MTRLRLGFMPDDYEIDDATADRWHRVVSDANWEKGRVLYEWRESLPCVGYRIEHFTKKVGGIVDDHAKRLMNVYARFHGWRSRWPDLLWAHFLAALDWEDAEKWLQWAATNKASVAQMRQERWQTM